MAQTKKAEVRDAIIGSGYRLFTSNGYSDTTLAQIAGAAGVTMSNIYNYFGSKLEILFAVYAPWLDARLDQLAVEVGAIDNPREKLRAVFVGILRNIPAENNCFANNLMQAISTRNASEIYSRKLLLRSEAKVSALLRGAMPDRAPWRGNDELLSHLLFMAFDGFAINYKLNGRSRRVEAICEMLCDLAMGAADGPSAAAMQGERTGARTLHEGR